MNNTKPEKKPSSKRSLIKDISLTSLGFELAIPIFGGVLFGYHLDRMSPSNYTFTLVFLIIGIVIGYYNLYKLIQLEIYRLNVQKNRSGEEGL